MRTLKEALDIGGIIPRHEVIDITEKAFEVWDYSSMDWYKGFYLYRDNRDTWYYRLVLGFDWLYTVERDRTDIVHIGDLIEYIKQDDLSSWDEESWLSKDEAFDLIINNI